MSEQELLCIVGGSWKVVAGIGAAIFSIGVINGWVRPNRC